MDLRESTASSGWRNSTPRRWTHSVFYLFLGLLATMSLTASFPAPPPSATGLQLVVGDGQSGPNNTIIVPVTVLNFTGLATFQGTVVFDDTELTYSSASSPLSNMFFGAPGQGSVPAGAITFLWYEPSLSTLTLTDGDTIAMLEFTVNSGASTGFTDIVIDGSATPLGYSTDPNSGGGLSTPTTDPGGVDIDADAPTIDVISIVSNNANDTELATVGNVISLSFTTSEEPDQTPVVTIAEGGPGAVTVSGSLTNYTATKTVATGSDGTTTFSIQIQDEWGNSSTATATTDGSFVIVDTEVPTITCPSPITQNTDAGECYATVSFADATGDDNLVSQGYAVTVSQTAGPGSGSQFNVGTTTITYTVTDAAGNVNSCDFDITVEDNEAPTVLTQDITVQLDANGDASIIASQIDNGSSDACGIASTSLDITSFGCGDLGTVTVTLTVTDVNGNSASNTAVVTVEDNIAPTIVCPAPQTIDTDAGLCTAAAPDLTGLATADDNCDSGPGGVNFNKIATGYHHTLFIKDDGSLWSTGYNSHGQLGLGFSSTFIATETQVGTDTDWAYVAGGEYKSFALKTDGTLWSWGRNAYGELGVPGNNNSPVQVGTDTDWVSVSCVTYNVLALKSDGSLWAWGYNIWGQLGIGSTTNQSSPVQVGTATDWVAAHTGNGTSMALKSDGTLWTWGRNNYGDLGIGSTTHQNTPVQVGTDTDWESIAVGFASSHGIKSNGTLWAWGRNNFAQLGIGSFTDQSSPLQVGTDSDWAEVSGGSNFGKALKNDGTLWTWGLGSNGRLGNGTTSGYVTSPAQIGTDTDWASFSRSQGAGSHAFALKSNNDVYGWGRSDFGQMGDGTTTDVSSPTAVGQNITPGYALVITQSPAPGTPLALGANTITLSTVDGSGNPASCTVVVTVEDNEAPTVVTQDITVQLDAAGAASITAAQIDNGSSDACGIASTVLDITSFDCSHVGSPVTVTLTVTDVNGNSSTATAVVTVQDNVAPTVLTQDITVQLDAVGAASITAAQIDNGSSDACGIASSSLDITSFDCNDIGNPVTVTLSVTDIHGNSDTETAVVTVEDNVAPTVVTQDITVQLDANGDASITAAQIDNGSSDACGVTSTSLDITSFGCGDVGTVTVTLTVTDVNGNSSSGTATVTVEDNIAPTIVCPAPQTLSADAGLCETDLPDLTGLVTVDDNCEGSGGSGGGTSSQSKVLAGNWISLVIANDGTLWASGRNHVGQFGNGTTNGAYQTTAIQVNTDTDWVSIGGGSLHSIGQKSDGTLWGWGRNNFGQLGIGSTSDQTSPTQIGTDTDWSMMTTGGSSGFAIKTDGTMWSWGNSTHGQLGLGNTTPYSSPQQIGTDTDWIWVRTSGSHTVAIKSNGTLWAWGRNHFGQLGIGSTSPNELYIPTQIGTDTDWTMADPGSAHTLAVKSDGSLWAWGYNIEGQLGLGNTSNQSSPQQVGAATDWAQIEALHLYSMAIKSDGTLWIWGDGALGQQGNGSTSDVLSPTQLGSDTDWAQLPTGDPTLHTLVSKSNNTLYGWGRNAHGQVGNGATSNVLTPFSITAFSPALPSSGSASNLTVTQSPIAGTTLAVGTHTVTITVADASGNTSSCDVDVTVEDNEAPTVLTQDITVQLDAAGAASITAAQIDNGSSDACGIASSSLDITSFTCSDVGNPVTVTLTITDVNGNSATETAVVTVQDNVTPTVLTQDITVQLDAAGAASITAAQIDNGSSDACGIASSTLDISSFDCNDVGNPVTVTLTVTDVNGNSDTETAVVTVEDNVAPTVLTQDISVQLDAAGNATITADDIDNGSTDNCAIDTRVLDISSFDCNDVALSPITVTLTVTDVNGNAAAQTALVTVLDDPIISVSGQATYPSVAAPVIPGVIWDLAGDDGPLTQTAPSIPNPGPYGFDFLLSPCGSTNDLGAYKIDDAATNNGVDIADAFGIVQHILLINPLNDPYKIIAADVNATQSINIFDAFHILQKLVGSKSFFTNPVTGVEDAIWTFIPSDYVFPNPASPYGFPTRRDYNSPTADAANQDFVGVKLGDVNQDWNPAALRTPAPADSFYFEMGQGLNSLTAGSRISIPVRVKDFNAITGYQLTMKWNAQALRLTGITDGALEGVYNDAIAADGYLSAAWVDFAGQSVSMKDGEIAFELEFEVIGEAGIEVRFEINSDATPVKAFDFTGERVGVGISSGTMTIGGTTSIDSWELKGYNLLQNVPNPFASSTNLIFSLGQTEEVDLAIYNVRGQLIQGFDGKYPIGEHQIEWNGRNEKGMEVAQGMYIVRIQAGGFSSAIRIQKMN